VASKKKYRFFANTILVKYIDLERPPEFKITVNDNKKVYIDGFKLPPISLYRNDELRKQLGLDDEICRIEDAEERSASDGVVLGNTADIN
jgi:hypothetical protein